MSCDPNELAAAAKCIACLDPKTQQAIQTYLLCQIAASSSSASGGLVGSGSPEGAQTANPGTPYLDSDTNSFWMKKTGTGNTGWVQLIA